MRVAVGADAPGALPDALIAELRRRGIEPIVFGALAHADPSWAAVGRAVGEAVAELAAELGVVCCWTGTGISIAVNKVTGARAALCADAATAQGARRWNDANVLALSMRATTPAVGLEILEMFLQTPVTDNAAELADIEILRKMDRSASHPGRAALR